MTFLQHLGSTLKTVLHIGVEAAAVAEPVVGLAFPEVIYRSINPHLVSLRAPKLSPRQ
jgi:hypothetical protein